MGNTNKAQPLGTQTLGAQVSGAQASGPAAGQGAPVDPPLAGTGPGDATPAGTTAADTGTRPSLSPSRAGDFLTCPLLYRFRVIDRLPEPPSAAAARGTLVHAVLERLFDEPPVRRTPETARAMLAPQWERLIAEEPDLASLFSDDEERSAWLAGASDMLDRYFTLEDPTRLEPRHREHAVEAVLESGLLLRGYIDRMDVRADGEIRIVDYKTGTAPREEFEARALFQMKFYAVVLWLTQQRVPKLLQLMYLGNGEIVRYAPDESDLRATVRKIDALWRAIERARATGDWRHRQSRLCEWCAHQSICPAFGGTPPPLPELSVTTNTVMTNTVTTNTVMTNTGAPAAMRPAGATMPAQANAPTAVPSPPAPSPEELSPPAIPAQPTAPDEVAAPPAGR